MKDNFITITSKKLIPGEYVSKEGLYNFERECILQFLSERIEDFEERNKKFFWK